MKRKGQKFAAFAMACTVAFAVVVGLALAGCANALNSTQTDSSKGTVVISLPGNAARTVFPSSAFDKYELTFETADNGLADQGKVVVGKGESTRAVLLDPGTWTVHVTGLVTIDGTDYPAAEGSSGAVEVKAGKSTPVSITLTSKQDGENGTFSYTVILPAGIVSAELEIAPVTGSGETEVADVLTEATGSRKLAPGYYLATLSAQNAYQIAVKTEVVHIYPKMTTNWMPSLAANDFAPIITLSGTVAIATNEEEESPDALSVFAFLGASRIVQAGKAKAELKADVWEWSMPVPASYTGKQLCFTAEGLKADKSILFSLNVSVNGGDSLTVVSSGNADVALSIDRTQKIHISFDLSLKIGTPVPDTDYAEMEVLEGTVLDLSLYPQPVSPTRGPLYRWWVLQKEDGTDPWPEALAGTQVTVTHSIHIYPEYLWGTWTASSSNTAEYLSTSYNEGVFQTTVLKTEDYGWQMTVDARYPAKTNTRYKYSFKAWTDSEKRTLRVQYYNNPVSEKYDTNFFVIDNTLKQYEFIGALKIDEDCNGSLGFQCGDQLGAFYISDLSIIATDDLPPIDGLTVTPTAEGFVLTADISKVPDGTRGFNFFCNDISVYYKGMNDEDILNGAEEVTIAYPFVTQGKYYSFSVGYDGVDIKTETFIKQAIGGLGEIFVSNIDDLSVVYNATDATVSLNGTPGIPALSNPKLTDQYYEFIVVTGTDWNSNTEWKRATRKEKNEYANPLDLLHDFKSWGDNPTVDVDLLRELAGTTVFVPIDYYYVYDGISYYIEVSASSPFTFPATRVDLSGISVKAGTTALSLTPAFSPDITAYTVDAKTAESVTLNAVARDPRAYTNGLARQESLQRGINKVVTFALGSDTDSKLTRTYTVTIKTDPIPVAGVSLNQTKLSLVKDGTAQLAATVLPANATNQNVTWSSSNTSVATVSSSGLVTAKADAGSATITATTQDGGREATCEVTVGTGTGITIAFAAPKDEAIDISGDIGKLLSKSNYDYLDLSVENGNVVEWVVDGNTRWYYEKGNYIYISAYDFVVGTHTVAAIVEIDGVPYSKEITFRVVK